MSGGDSYSDHVLLDGLRGTGATALGPGKVKLAAVSAGIASSDRALAAGRA
jgi:hypothetical protein